MGAMLYCVVTQHVSSNWRYFTAHCSHWTGWQSADLLSSVFIGIVSAANFCHGILLYTASKKRFNDA